MKALPIALLLVAIPSAMLQAQPEVLPASDTRSYSLSGYYYAELEDGSILSLDMPSFSLYRMMPGEPQQLIAQGSATDAVWPDGSEMTFEPSRLRIRGWNADWLLITDSYSRPLLVSRADPAIMVPLDTELTMAKYGRSSDAQFGNEAAFLDGILVIADDDSQMLGAFDMQGQPLWELNAGRYPQLLPAADGLAMYVSCAYGLLLAVDREGTVSWSNPRMQDCVTDGSNFYGYGSDGRLRALGLDGSLLWEREMDSICLPLAVSDGRIMAHDNRRTVLCISTAGEELWRTELPVGDTGFAYFVGAPDGHVFAFARYQQPYDGNSEREGMFPIRIAELGFCVDLEGHIIWQTGDGEMVRSHGALTLPGGLIGQIEVGANSVLTIHGPP